MALPRLSPMPWGLLVLTGVYFVVGKLGLILGFSSSTAVWPPAGIALAAPLLLGYRVWPALFVGSFLVNVTTEGSVWTTLGVASGNTLAGLLGAFLVTRFAGGRNVFGRARDIFAFAALAGFLSTAVSATIGATCLSLAGFASWDRFGALWLTRWLGSAAGVLVVAPALILWGVDRTLRLTGARAMELALLLGSVVVVGLAVFGGLGSAWVRVYPLEFLCVPLLILAAFRFGPREAATCVVLFSAIATWGTSRGAGPFVWDTENESLLLLQALMGTMAMMTLLLAAVIAGRGRGEEAVTVAPRRVAEGRIVGAAASARDITDRKRKEVALRERDALRYVASLAAAAAHEINNPLAAVMGHTHLLAHEVDAKARERIDAIAAAASRIAQIVARMRGVTRVEPTDEAPYLPEMLDLNKSSERLREHQRL